MMLYQFVNSNRDELILRCREKVKKRFPPIGVPAVLDHGVPLFDLHRLGQYWARPVDVFEPVARGSDCEQVCADLRKQMA